MGWAAKALIHQVDAFSGGDVRDLGAMVFQLFDGFAKTVTVM